MIPYADIDTLFLDVGNTLVSIDFDWIARELTARGVGVAAADLHRAEAAARPRVSAVLAGQGELGRIDFSFGTYLGGIFDALEARGSSLRGRRDALVDELVPVLRPAGATARLWSQVLPGVPEALAAFRALGLRLIVVSNSDGSVEQTLREQGLVEHFHAVLDSALVGHEKPDRRIFDHAIEVSGATAGRTLHVGDLYSADVVGARRAGIHALLLDPFDDWTGIDAVRLPDLTALHRELAAARRA